MQPTTLSNLIHRFTPALLAAAVALPQVGCGEEDAAKTPAPAPTNPPLIQQQPPEDPQGTDLNDVDTPTPQPQTPETPTPQPLVQIDPYRVLEESIAQLPNVHLAEVYFDLGSEALERAEASTDYIADRLVVWLVVEDLGLLIENVDRRPDETLQVLHILPDATKDQIMQLVTEAFPDAESVDIFVDQESSDDLDQQAESELEDESDRIDEIEPGRIIETP